MTKLLLH